MTSHYVLKIQYVNKPPETRNIGARVTSIGREAGDIVLGDPQSSGRHAEIHFENGGVRVKDLGSTNGTFFGGQRSPEFTMEAGQGFSIGQTVMTLMSIQGAQRAGAGKTMIAVGGMPRGGGAPPRTPPGPPGMPPGPPGFGPPPGSPPGAPPQGGGFGAPPPGGGFGAPPPGAPPQGGGFGAPPPGGGFGAPPPSSAPPGAPPQGAYGAPPQGAPPPGAPPQGAYGAPPPQGAYGAPPPNSPPSSSPQPGYGGPPQGGPPQGGPPQGAPPQGGGYGAPPGGAPMAAVAGDAMAVGAAAGQAFGAPPNGGPPAYGQPGPSGMSSMSSGGEARGDFSGTGGELLGQLFVGYLLTLITFGIYSPWFMCKFVNFISERVTFGPTAKGTVRFKFEGQGGQLFVTFLVGYLLTMITFGIYGPWFMCKLAKFFADNTTATADDGSVYKPRFDGAGGDLFVTFLVGYLLTMVTFGIYGAWFMCKMNKWFAENTKITKNGQDVGGMDFVGEGGELLMTFIVGYLLTIVTFGIYMAWFQVKLLKFNADNTKINVDGQRLGMRFTGEGGELFVMILVGYLLTIVTLGFYMFWFMAKLLKWQLSNTTIFSEGAGAPMSMGMGGGQVQQFGGPPAQGQMPYGQPQPQLGGAPGPQPGYGAPPQGGQGGYGGPPQGGGYA